MVHEGGNINTAINNQQSMHHDGDDEIQEISFKQFPKTFNVLFAFAGKRCTCHKQRMTATQLFEHEGYDFEKWLRELLNVPKQLMQGRNKKRKAVYSRRLQERFVQRLVETAQRITFEAPDQQVRAFEEIQRRL